MCLTKAQKAVTISPIWKGSEGKSKSETLVQRAPVGGMGYGKEQAEDGPGAAQAIGSLCRVRPLMRRSMLVLPEAVFARKL